MKAWLKGGIIFSTLALINIILVSLIELSISPFSDILTKFDGLNFIQAILSITPLLLFGIVEWGESIPNWLEPHYLLYTGIINIIFYFIVGAIIGWIIGFIINKIKSKKEKIQSLSEKKYWIWGGIIGGIILPNILRLFLGSINLLILFFIGFIIGALIGLIISKLKYKKQQGVNKVK